MTDKKAYMAAYYAANKEKMKAGCADYYAVHREVLCAKSSAYYAAHPEECKTYGDGSCNCSKGPKDPLVFMRELGMLL